MITAKQYESQYVRKAERYYQAIEYLGGKCLDCGYSKDLRALEFDHVPERGTKFNNISMMLMTYSWTRMQDELDKCDLVCANCHRIRTHERSQFARKSNRP